ncbi:hypothetical protein BCT41_08095 [Vibrio splendidus]|uniref:DNA-directed DNA polymerase n=1 Tax=Vibrio splendidus TaxID=29497 RepID=UPI000C822998|nr:DNA-directed DNA polymerase [Vibrio splendidus]PMN03900.1 hypothetical protein BCT41_08095 [Vibrio splendidus]
MTKSQSSSDNAKKAYVSTTSFSPILGAQATERATTSAQLQDFIDTWRYRFEPEYQRNSTLELGEYLKSRKQPIKEEGAVAKEIAECLSARKSRFKYLQAQGGNVHIGIDTEFEYDEENECNLILSYQYCLLTADGREFKGVDYPKSTKKEDRFDFNDYIFKIINRAKKHGWISEYPEKTFIYAHFMRADLASFHAYWNIKSNRLDAAKDAVNSARGDYGLDLRAIGASQYKPRFVSYKDNSKRTVKTTLHLKDTLFLSPGRCSLDVIGDAIGIPKIKIPDGYSIEKMSKLLKENKGVYEQYAIRDAEIAVKYGRYVEDFALTELNDVFEDEGSDEQRPASNRIKYLPNTLGNLSVSLFKNVFADDYAKKVQVNDDSVLPASASLNNIFGMEEVISYKWDERNHRSIPNKLLVLSGERDRNEATARRCFFGGRNEDYYFGPSPVGKISDWDLAGAYTTGLVDILPVNYRAAFSSTKIDDYLGHVMGFAYVKFKFKEGTRFPSLPVRTEVYGLYYPLEGETYCTAPEIAVAYNMGCDIEILYGDIIPWADDAEPVFEPFTKVIRKLRKRHKGTFEEKIVKDVGNTLYGKIASGVGFQRNKFDTKTGLSKASGTSPVTNSYFSSHVTGFIRGVLSELLANVDEGVTVYSATTDGLLTDLDNADSMLIDEYRVNGKTYQSTTARFKALCAKFGDDEALVLKHQVKQIIAMKTRGQLTAEMMVDDGTNPDMSGLYKKPVTAKAGIKPPRDCPNENDWMVNLFLNRQPSEKIANNCIVSERDMYLHELDLIEIKHDKYLNLDFDFKRRPVNPSMLDVRNPVTGEVVSHLTFDTVPWQTHIEGEKARSAFDGWRKGQLVGKKPNQERVGGNCLKTMDDWRNWMDFYKIKAVMEVKGQKYEDDSSEGIFKRYVMTAITNDLWGMTKDTVDGVKRTYPDLAELFTRAGYSTLGKDFSNAKGRQVVANMMPAAPKLIPMLIWLMGEFPDMEVEMFFMPEELDGVMTLVASARDK